MEGETAGQITDTRNEPNLRSLRYRAHDTTTVEGLKNAVATIPGWTCTVQPEPNSNLIIRLHVGPDTPKLYLRDR